MPKLKIDPSSFHQYMLNGFSLLPLHRYNAIDSKGRERGKSPADRNWRETVYPRKVIDTHILKGNNVGVRLSSKQLVIDVDPRRFPKGRDPLREFCVDTGLDPTKCPTVKTGSGGVHLYMSKPDGIKLVDSLKDYPGVEFKSAGRQVVAAGSIHPNGNIYEWNEFRPDLDLLPNVPSKLLTMIERPNIKTSDEEGDLNPEMLVKCLEHLDAKDYSDHGKWLTIMMACHHATGGEGRQEFIDWSTSDPEYTDHAYDIGRRWDSLHSDRGGITQSTLFKDVREAGGEIPIIDAEQDFADLTPEELELVAKSPRGIKARKSPLELMNDQYKIVMVDGVFRVMEEKYDTALERVRYVYSRKTDFLSFNEHKKIETDDNKTRFVAEEWLKWPKAHRLSDVIFNPDPKWPYDPTVLNLWKGWSVKKESGDWSLMKDLILNVICSGSQANYEYLLSWMAYMVQFPHLPAEVAIVLRGKQGTGKGSFARPLVRLAGQHGMHISRPEHLFGKFNGHLRDCILLFADESFYTGSKAGESALKALVTEPTISYEAKGKDLQSGKNMIHIVMASNKDWVVPTGMDERRYAVFDVSDGAQQDKKFWTALNKQMDKGGGGLEAMLYDLVKRDLSKWHPRNSIPQNEALTNQKLESLDTFGKWWFETLYNGSLPGAIGSWDDFSVRIPTEVFFNLYYDYARKHNVRDMYPSKISLGHQLNKYVKNVQKKRMKLPEGYGEISLQLDQLDRAVHYVVPPLDICKEMFVERVGQIDWS